jgi:SAM-dependent methyltransferase
MTLSEHAREQGRLWGTDPAGWARYGEPHNEPLFLAVLDAAAVGDGTRLLDIGCGTGATLVIARDRGADITGLDVCDPLLAIARDRLLDADLVVGEADALPFPDGCFDAVVGVNAFQFAADPRIALAEAARVLAPGGRVVASLFAEPERSQSTAIHLALSALAPPVQALSGLAPAGTGPAPHTPYLLSEPGNLEAAFEGTGLRVVGSGEVSTVWDYPDPEALVRGILASAGGARALTFVDRATAAAAVIAAAEPFVQPDGSVRMQNLFRWVRAESVAVQRIPGGGE